MELLPLLVWLLVIALIAFVAFWLVDRSGIPSPMNWIIKAICALIVLVALLSRLDVNIGGL